MRRNHKVAEVFEAIGGYLDDIHNSEGLRSALNSILKRTIKLLDATAGEIAIFNLRRSALEIKAVIGRPDGTNNEKYETPSFMHTVWESRAETWRYEPDVSTLGPKEYFNIDPKVKSEAAVRIEFAGRRVGCLNIEWHHAPKIPAENLGTILNQVAKYAAIRVRMDEERRQYSLVEQLLTDVPGSSRDKLPIILEDILTNIHELFGFDGGVIYVVDAKRHRLEVRGWRTPHPEPFGFPLDEISAATRVFNSAKPFFCQDVRNDPEGIVNLRGTDKFNINGPMLGIPLIFGNKPVGVLMSWSNSGTSPARDDQQRLKLLAILAAWKIGVWLEEHDRGQESQLNRSIVDHLQIALFQKDLDSKFTYANKFFYVHLNQNSADAVIGKRDADFFDKQCADKYRQDDIDVIATEKSMTIRGEKHRLIGGPEMLVDGVKVPIRDAGGKVVGVQCAFWEASSRTNAGADAHRFEQLIGELKQVLARFKDRARTGRDAVRTTPGKTRKTAQLPLVFQTPTSPNSGLTKNIIPNDPEFQLEKEEKDVLAVLESDPEARWKSANIRKRLDHDMAPRTLGSILQRLKSKGRVNLDVKPGGMSTWGLPSSGKKRHGGPARTL